MTKKNPVCDKCGTTLELAENKTWFCSKCKTYSLKICIGSRGNIHL